LHSLGTLYHQSLGEVINNNVKKKFRTFGIAKIYFEKKIIEKNLITIGMVKVL
jgi:hypothetical protein